MTRTMYDSVNASAIPADATLIAGYVDGNTVWSDADWARFPNATKVRIAVNPATDDGSVLDVERGNWPAADAVPWIVMRRAAGAIPTVYGNNGVAGYRLTEVTAACVAQGVAPPQFWFASWGSPATLPDGYVALQYANGPDYDTSVVADYWPGVDPAPVSDVPDITDAQTDIVNARALLAQATTLLEHAEEDLNSPSTPTPASSVPPSPQPVLDLQAQLNTLNARADAQLDITSTLNRRLSSLESSVTALEDTPLPVPQPQPQPAPSHSAVSPTWLPLVLAALLIVVQQALTIVGTLPKSTPVTVTLLILTILAASIPAIETLLNQQTGASLTAQRERQAHELAMAQKNGTVYQTVRLT